MAVRHLPLRKLLLPPALIALCAAILPSAQAGGPKYIAGASYFNSGLAGTPLTWSQGAITYYTDHRRSQPHPSRTKRRCLRGLCP